MKQYPTIPKKPKSDSTKFWVFDKLDGSNIRAEWSKKRGFHKFGTRKRLLGTDQGLLSKAQGLIEILDYDFQIVFGHKKIERAVCFFEFWGDNSFAGNHAPNDNHRVTLIDVDVYKQGLIPPGEFLNMFAPSNIDYADMLYFGPVDEVLRKQVVDGILPGMTYEGVVCKAAPKKRFHESNMFKIKSQAWIDRVKANFDPSRWEDLL